MADRNLEAILKLLLRTPLSQTALGDKLGLSRSHVSALTKSLMEQGFIVRDDDLYLESEDEPGTRRRQRLKIVKQSQCTAVVIHSAWEFSLSLYALGELRPIMTVNIAHERKAKQMCLKLKAALAQALEQAKIAPEQLKFLVFATQASLEQGLDGILFRDNVLEDDSCPLAKMLTACLGVPTYVCNYAYAHLLCLLHSGYLNIDSALALLCGEGSVAFGIFIDGKIVLGPHQTFTECSHLPYPGGIEAALGTYSDKTADALIYAIESLAPIFKIWRIILAGSCFDEHPGVIAAARKVLVTNSNPLMRHTKLEYWPHEIARFRDELALLSFEELIGLLDLRVKHKSLADFVRTQEAL